MMVGKDVKLPDYLILVSTLGGLQMFGLNGFVIGPLVAALFVACWRFLGEAPEVPRYGQPRTRPPGGVLGKARRPLVACSATARPTVKLAG